MNVTAIDKGRREQIAKTKHIRRCKALGLKPEEHYNYKAQGKPCSCAMCSPYKYNRKTKHKNE